MPFKPKNTKRKVAARSRSIYISDALAARVEQVAKENDTSFNNVVISMIEYCLSESGEEKTNHET